MKPRAHRVSVCWMSLKSLVRKVFSFLLLIPIYFYRVCISPLTPPSCRFTPTCSAYAVEVIKKHGPVKGLYLAAVSYTHLDVYKRQLVCFVIIIDCAVCYLK